MASYNTLSDIRGMLNRLPSYIPVGANGDELGDTITDLCQLVTTMAQVLLEHEDDFAYGNELVDLKDRAEEWERVSQWAFDEIDTMKKSYEPLLKAFKEAQIHIKGDKGDKGEPGDRGLQGIGSVLNESPLWAEQQEQIRDLQDEVRDLKQIITEITEEEEESVA